MSRSRTFLALALAAPAALLLSLAACDDAVDPDLSVRGTLRFDYSGDMTGTFSASGEVPLDASGMPTSIPTSGAVAVKRPSALMLIGVRSSGGGEGDALALQLGNFTGVGTYSMNLSSCGDPDAPASCRIGAFMPGISLAELRTAADVGPLAVQDVFVTGIGSVTVTEYTGTRVRGTFSLSAVAPPSTGFFAITFSNGQFELPVRVVP